MEINVYNIIFVINNITHIWFQEVSYTRFIVFPFCDQEFNDSNMIPILFFF